MKAGVFVRPQIKQIMECKECPKKLTRMEEAAWNSFVALVSGFLGNHKSQKYVELVEIMVKNYSKMGCRMSLKVHIHDAHLNTFRRTWEHTRKSKANASTTKYWPLNAATKDCIMKT